MKILLKTLLLFCILTSFYACKNIQDVTTSGMIEYDYGSYD